MYPGKPITKKVTKMYPGKPITNFFRVNQLGLKTLKNLEKYHKFVQNYGNFPSFSVQVFFFFAYLHELGCVKKNLKKVTWLSSVGLKKKLI